MTGEMSASEVTRENYPLYFAIADAYGGTVHPFDQYQGPYIMVGAEDATSGGAPYAVPVPTWITGGHRLWMQSDDGAALQVYDETTEKLSAPFLLYHDDHDDAHQAISAAAEVTGLSPKRCPVCDRQDEEAKRGATKKD